MCYAAQALSWRAVGPLVRAGADVNQRARWANDVLTAPLHDVIRAWYIKPGNSRLRTALELVRHGGHLFDWGVQDENGLTPLECAEWYVKKHPKNKEATLLYELYKTRNLPHNIPLTDEPRIHHEEGATIFKSTSLIKVGFEGDADAIGPLISTGAMVNERDDAGRTLLHLVAMGVVPDGYAVVVEVVRHGGHGVDWDALTVDGYTAEDLAKRTLGHLSAIETKKPTFIKRKLRQVLPARLQRHSPPHYRITYQEAAKILELLQRQALPQGIHYIYPCMDPNYCSKCSSLSCAGDCPK